MPHDFSIFFNFACQLYSLSHQQKYNCRQFNLVFHFCYSSSTESWTAERSLELAGPFVGRIVISKFSHWSHSTLKPPSFILSSSTNINLISFCIYFLSVISRVPMPKQQQTIAWGSRCTFPPAPPARNEQYATFPPAWHGILTGRLGEVSKLFTPHCSTTVTTDSKPPLSTVLGSAAQSSQLDRSISDVPLMPCLERVSEWLVPVYPSSTQAYEMFSSKLTWCFSQLECLCV